MARSTYVYLVTEANEPVAAFTVKWEMEWWISHNSGVYRKFRMGDGLSGVKNPVEMT